MSTNRILKRSWFKHLRETPISKFSFGALCVALTAGLLVTGYFSYDYHQLNQERDELQLLRSTQKLEIKTQQLQIEAFSQKMEALQERITELEMLENKIREQADLEAEKTAAELFGIGGGTTANTLDELDFFGIGGVSTDVLDLSQDMETDSQELLSTLHQQANVVEAVIDLKTDDFRDLLKGLEEKAAHEAYMPSIYPVEGGRVTSRFGYRRAPYSGRKEFHKGYDIGASRGTPIKATANGRVQSASWNRGYGKMITINHGNGYLTRYAHAHKLLKKKGAVVKKGDVIALVGSTGRSTGPHVHYEVRKNGKPVDPQKYFTASSKKNSNNRKVAKSK